MHFSTPFPNVNLDHPCPPLERGPDSSGLFWSPPNLARQNVANTTRIYFHSEDAGCCGLKCRPEAEGHGSLRLSLLSVQELLLSQRINPSALCFPCREWNLLAVHAASLRMSVEKLKPRTQMQTWALAWSHLALQMYSWRLRHRLALCVDRTFAMRGLDFYHANICSVGTVLRASCGS